MADAPAASDQALRMSYRIGRGEQGVLTFEPYKSALLPLWRFRTAATARESAVALRARFDEYAAAGNFVGADMARKFLQMGMTRAKRYANYKGGRKYDEKNGEDRKVKEKVDHAGKKEKEEASRIFRAAWEAAKKEKTYVELKEAFIKEQKAWDNSHKKS